MLLANGLRGIRSVFIFHQPLNYKMHNKTSIKKDGSVFEVVLNTVSDCVYDFVKTDDSIWGFDAFLDFMTCPSQTGASDLDRLLDYAQDLTQTDTFEEDFTILEVAFE